MSAICDADKKKVDVELLYNLVHRKIRSVADQTSAVKKTSTQQVGPQAPCWAELENGKETLLWPIEWVSICCSSVRFPTPSHSKTLSNPFEPFQIKWEVYFSKGLCRSSLLCRRYDSACMHMCMYSDHGYTTKGCSCKGKNTGRPLVSEKQLGRVCVCCLCSPRNSFGDLIKSNEFRIWFLDFVEKVIQ